MSQFRIRELRIRNYRAFADARLKLDEVTFLVGRNGAGKSTLLDAFSFVSEALTDSLGTALERRGSLEGLRRRQSGRGAKRDLWAAIVFDFKARRGIYGFQLAVASGGTRFVVRREWLRHAGLGFLREGLRFQVLADDRASAEDAAWATAVRATMDGMAAPSDGGLAFPIFQIMRPEWSQVFERLARFSFHQFIPSEIKAEPAIGRTERLSRTGANAGDVLKRTKPRDRAWIAERLAVVAPGIRDVKAAARAGRRVIVVDQEVEGGGVGEFELATTSDGTARSLGVLLALRQTPRPSLVLIDEIEDSLHPSALAVILESIETVSPEFPIVVSTHSPEVLSLPQARGERIRVIEREGGQSRLHHLGDRVLKELKPPMNVGRLLRSNGLWTAEPSLTGSAEDFSHVD